MLEMNLAALGNQIEQRLTIARAQLFKFHRATETVRDSSTPLGMTTAEIRKLVCLSREFLRRRHPFAAGRSEDRQFFHHELRFAEGADHLGAGCVIPPCAHLLAGMATPALDVGVARENPAIDLAQLRLVQERFGGAVHVASLVEDEASPV